MALSDFKTIKFERSGRVITATFNQPDKLNTFTGLSHTELSLVWDELARDEDSDIIVVTGAGRAFSAGGEIQPMQDLRENPAKFFGVIREAKRIVSSILDCDKPIVAKVNGDAIGLGATVAMFCDITIANETARIADPHNNVGLIAGDGGSVIWPQLIGYARARHYLLTGARLNGREAADIGLIYQAVAADELDAAVDAYVKTLSSLPAQSLRWTKATYTIPLKQLAISMMDAGMAYEGLASRTDDHGEAIEAFSAKRKPQFGKR